MSSAHDVLAKLGWDSQGPAFVLEADGRRWSPEAMEATGPATWEAEGVVVRLETTQREDGSFDVVLEVDGVEWVDEVCLLDAKLGQAPSAVKNHRWYDHLGFQQSTAVFVRERDADQGVFACYANPFGRFESRADGRHLKLWYRPAMAVGGSYRSEPLVLGAYQHEGVEVRREGLPGRDITNAGTETPMYLAGFGPVPAVLDRGEVRAVRAAVSARMPWRAQKARVSHWDWAQNLYRWDMGVEADRALPMFDRMAQVAAEIGVELQLLSVNIDGGPGKGIHHEDGMCVPLYFLGRGVEVGRLQDDSPDHPEPPAVEALATTVRKHGLGLVAYSNPQAIWGKREEWGSRNEQGDLQGWGCMAVAGAQDAAIAQYQRFAEEHGLAGYSMDFMYWVPCHGEDHGHRPGADSLYAQWRGLRRIVAAVAEKPDAWVEGLIGSQHLLPWGIGEMAHPHPVLGDNQPQWLPAWPDLSLLRVAANFQRRTAWIMRNMALMPSWKVPGLFGHQASRYSPNPVERGWDWDGARYCLLSAIASGPSSMIVGFLPVWDSAEWAGMRERDAAFFRHWIDWAKEHAEVLTRLEDLYGEPRPGMVDGTIALDDDGRGFAFLANPDYEPLKALVEGRVLRELYPHEGRLWRDGVVVEPKTVMVFEVLDRAVEGAMEGDYETGEVAPRADGITPTLGPWTEGDDGWLRTSWAPGAALAPLLATMKPPVEPRGQELRQPWMDPSRLRLHVEVIDPKAATVRMRVNGHEMPVKPCWVGTFEHVTDRDFAVMENNLMGWYADLTDLLAVTKDPDAPWTVDVHVDLRGEAEFRGVHIAHLPRP